MASTTPKKTLKDLQKANDGNISNAQDYIDAGRKINAVPPGTGLFNTRTSKPQFTYNKPDGAKQLENGGAFIVFGQVPPGGLATGYGSSGTPSETIDLVVGRQASSFSGNGPAKNSVVDNNFATDAARIYISRLCDIDKAFGLENLSNQKAGQGSVARSGIGIKADAVRMIGRTGVKITTGKMRDAEFGLRGETNSLGGAIGNPAPKIELIAGNNHSNTQGIVLGNNMSNCLSELTDIFGELWSAVYQLALSQAGYNTANGIDVLRPWVPAVAATTNIQQTTKVIGPLYQTRVNMEFWKLNYLSPTGKEYIASKNILAN